MTPPRSFSQREPWLQPRHTLPSTAAPRAPQRGHLPPPGRWGYSGEGRPLGKNPVSKQLLPRPPTPPAAPGGFSLIFTKTTRWGSCRQSSRKWGGSEAGPPRALLSQAPILEPRQPPPPAPGSRSARPALRSGGGTGPAAWLCCGISETRPLGSAQGHPCSQVPGQKVTSLSIILPTHGFRASSDF